MPVQKSAKSLVRHRHRRTGRFRGYNHRETAASAPAKTAKSKARRARGDDESQDRANA